MAGDDAGTSLISYRLTKEQFDSFARVLGAFKASKGREVKK